MHLIKQMVAAGTSWGSNLEKLAISKAKSQALKQPLFWTTGQTI